MKTLKQTLAATALTASMATTVNAQALNTCAATYTVAAAYLAQQNLNSDATDAAEMSVLARRAARVQNWGGRAEISDRMYRQSLEMKQIRFRNSGVTGLSEDLKQCHQVIVAARLTR